MVKYRAQALTVYFAVEQIDANFAEMRHAGICIAVVGALTRVVPFTVEWARMRIDQTENPQLVAEKLKELKTHRFPYTSAKFVAGLRLMYDFGMVSFMRWQYTVTGNPSKRTV